MITQRAWTKATFDRYLLSYNGMSYNPEQREIFEKGCTYNTSKSDDDRRECLKYSISSCNGHRMEIPPDSDQMANFASYGPKVNHKFYHAKCIYMCIEHPRFGLSMGVFLKAGHQLSAGEEVFTDYGYKTKLPFPVDYPWYWAMQVKVDQLESSTKVKRSKGKKRKKHKTEL